MDGRIALANGESKWLTGPLAREDVQLQRAKACAIISSAETVLADNARLDLRSAAITPMADGQLRQPLRVILDRRARLTGAEAMFQAGGRVVVIYATHLASLPNRSMTLRLKLSSGRLMRITQVFWPSPQ
ncbi:MAG: RibD family protein [Rheinheimera sp.]|nr:RibD family protein [Rheinheimera sp.]